MFIDRQLGVNFKSYIDADILRTATRLKAMIRNDNITFEKKIQKIEYIFRDVKYQEVDGIYFVYHGKIDLITPDLVSF